jgi:LmbE family N-acetylglucosaminyl deacetylase
MYNLDLISRQEQARKFDDNWREYLRNQKDKEDQKVLGMIKAEMENKTQTIRIAEDQLKNGVESIPE